MRQMRPIGTKEPRREAESAGKRPRANQSLKSLPTRRLRLNEQAIVQVTLINVGSNGAFSGRTEWSDGWGRDAWTEPLWTPVSEGSLTQALGSVTNLNEDRALNDKLSAVRTIARHSPQPTCNKAVISPSEWSALQQAPMQRRRIFGQKRTLPEHLC